MAYINFNKERDALHFCSSYNFTGQLNKYLFNPFPFQNQVKN